MILKTIHCSVCDDRCTEEQPGEGFPNWGQLTGITFNGDENPTLCPACLTRVATFMDELDNEERS